MEFYREHLLDNDACGSLTVHYLANEIHEMVLRKRDNIVDISGT
jgi:hypothetical protein